MKNKVVLIVLYLILCGSLVAQDKANIYLDASKSMHAYMSQDRLEANTYIDFLLNASALLVASGFNDSVIKPMGSSIMAPVPISGISRFANVKKTKESYAQNETNLVGALNDILAAGGGLNLIVTDAVLSKVEGAAQGDCSDGYDLGCFMDRFGVILDKGWSVHAIGITSWFKGTYYSEMLRVRGARDYKIQAVEGLPRPFYIFVIGLDRQKTQVFANKVENWFIQSYGRKHAFLRLRKLKIAPYAAPRVAWTGELPRFLTDDRHDAIFSLVGESARYRRVPRKMKGKYLRLDFAAEMRYSEGPECVPYYAFEHEITLSPEPSKKEYEIKIESRGAQKKFSVYFSPAVVEKMGAQFNLNVRLWPRFHPVDRPVWEDWSTPNDALEENVNKTLNISPLLSYLLGHSLARTKVPAASEVKKQILFCR